MPDTKYCYYITPYFISDSGKIYYGNEIKIETKKTPSTSLGENWWIDEI